MGQELRDMAARGFTSTDYMWRRVEELIQSAHRDIGRSQIFQEREEKRLATLQNSLQTWLQCPVAAGLNMPTIAYEGFKVGPRDVIKFGSKMVGG